MATTAATQLDPTALLARVQELESKLLFSEARCAKLEYKLRDLLRRIFGPKSEKLNPAQPERVNGFETPGVMRLVCKRA